MSYDASGEKSNPNELDSLSERLMALTELDLLDDARERSKALPSYLRHVTSEADRDAILSEGLRSSAAGTFGPGVYLTDLLTPLRPGEGLRSLARTLQIPMEAGVYCPGRCCAFIDLSTDGPWARWVWPYLRNAQEGEVPPVEYVVKLPPGVDRLDLNGISILSGIIGGQHWNR